MSFSLLLFFCHRTFSILFHPHSLTHSNCPLSPWFVTRKQIHRHTWTKNKHKEPSILQFTWITLDDRERERERERGVEWTKRESERGLIQFNSTSNAWVSLAFFFALLASWTTNFLLLSVKLLLPYLRWRVNFVLLCLLNTWVVEYTYTTHTYIDTHIDTHTHTHRHIYTHIRESAVSWTVLVFIFSPHGSDSYTLCSFDIENNTQRHQASLRWE